MLQLSASPRCKAVALRLSGFVSLIAAVVLQIQTNSFAHPPGDSLTFSVDVHLLDFGLLVQIVFQLWWLFRTPLSRPSKLHIPDVEAAVEVAETQIGISGSSIPKACPFSYYMPYFVFGNICLAMWAVAMQRNSISLGQIVLLIAILPQLRIAFPALRTISEPVDKMTVLLSKLFMGTFIMYLWRTWASIDVGIPPSPSQKIHSGVVFTLLTVAPGPDPTIGVILIYVLLSLYLGSYQNSGWPNFFLLESGILASILAVEALVSRLDPAVPEVTVNACACSARLSGHARDEERSSLLGLPPFDDEHELQDVTVERFDGENGSSQGVHPQNRIRRDSTFLPETILDEDLHPDSDSTNPSSFKMSSTGGNQSGHSGSTNFSSQQGKGQVLSILSTFPGSLLR
ncbi:hypothetical protein GYMLUDRAFT_74540 [Collybiopsis luxurians FD-317 M1]|uniref:Uncharacterized protein n=1 Tax=Collybiopsis luxurians FD-317 M1 TaxID=944289 RepID=A0A0D0BUV0_9AGAR|nr:hypothetical protein GYMLUDRAFT_74540 [Collybiopsis luxurians FD-317 M1]